MNKKTIEVRCCEPECNVLYGCKFFNRTGTLIEWYCDLCLLKNSGDECRIEAEVGREPEISHGIFKMCLIKTRRKNKKAIELL